LKDSLGGNSKTIMIATVRSLPDYYTQTSVSLMYAGRAKKIQNRSLVNHNVIGDTGIQAVTTEIERLRTRLDDRVNEFQNLRAIQMRDHSENLQLKGRLEKLNVVNERERKQLESQMSFMIHSHAGELQKQSEKIKTLQSELQKELDESQNRVAEQEKEIKWLKQALDEHEQAAEGPREQLERLKKLSSAWQTQAQQSKSELDSVAQRLQQVEAEKLSNQEELQVLKKDSASLEGRMREVTDTASRMAAQLGEQQAKDVVQAARLVDIQASYQSLVQAHDELRGRFTPEPRA
jgi:chromosome segregation ATPase